MSKELNPLYDLVYALNEQIDLPTRINTPRPKGGSKSKEPVIAAGYDWEQNAIQE